MSKSNPSSLRQRPTTKPTSNNPAPPTSASSTKSNDHSGSTNTKRGSGISPLDILRVVTTLLALALSLSYYLTSGDSLTFNYRPWFTRLDRIKAYARGPLTLTPTQLSLYNGSDAALPIYLAINATIFDVSISPHTYGPGGSYHVFAGRDATRAFVTGCFSEDLTGDLRGVEGMFIPVEDEEEGGDGGEGLSKGQKKIRAEQERREARKKVAMEVERWVGFYRGSGKYFEVGRVVDHHLQGTGGARGVGEGVHRNGGEVPKLCEAAEGARPRRSQLNKQNAEGAEAGGGKGKPVFKPMKGSQGKPVRS